MSTVSAILHEVPVDAFLRRLVVVGHDLQRAVGADLLRVAREHDRFRGRIRARAGHDRDAAACMLHGDADDLAVFLDAHGGRLARGADDADAGGALGDVPVDQARRLS
jgi:hypothetical protein